MIKKEKLVLIQLPDGLLQLLFLPWYLPSVWKKINQQKLKQSPTGHDDDV